jgi:hypothetical protein
MPRGFRSPRVAASVRVHSYASLHVGNDQDLATELKGLAARKSLPKKAWVNLWGLKSSHQYLLLPTRARAELDETSRFRAATALAMDPRDIAIGTVFGRATNRWPARSRRSSDSQSKKTEVVVFAAALQDIRARLRPIVEAGFVVDGVTTPCGALWSQARLRRPGSAGDVHAFVALGANMSAVSVFANGFFLYGRDLTWGYAGTPDRGRPPMEREELADRLALELRRSFLYVKQYWEPDITQLLLCGDMPEIRSLTAPLIDRLNIEVETLDTLEGIDPMNLPEPADRFTDQAAAFRLATAIAVETLPVNLLGSNQSTGYLNRINRRVVAGGAAAAVAFAAFAYTRSGVDRGSARVEGQIAAAHPAVKPPSNPVTPPGSIRALPAEPRVAPAEARVLSGDARELAGEAPPPRSPRATGPTRPSPDSARVQQSAPVAIANRSAQAPDPVVRSILYSASRQVALVDGRIVKPGDRLGAMFVSAIERDAIILTTPGGLRKRIGLDRPTVSLGRQ